MEMVMVKFSRELNYYLVFPSLTDNLLILILPLILRDIPIHGKCAHFKHNFTGLVLFFFKLSSVILFYCDLKCTKTNLYWLKEEEEKKNTE